MPETAIESTTAQRAPASEAGKGPANVTVDALTAMFKRPRAAKGAAAKGSSPGNEAPETGQEQKQQESGTDAAVSAAAASGASPDSSEGVGNDKGQSVNDQEPPVNGTNGQEAEAQAADALGGDEAAEGEGEETPAPEDVPKAISDMRKRIGKLTKRLRETEAALETERSQAQARQTDGSQERRARSDAPYQQGVDPRFVGDEPLTKMASDLEQADAIADWAEERLDEFAANGIETVEFGGREYSRAEVRKLLRNANAQRSELTAAKAARLQQLETTFNNSLNQYNAMAVKAYPWMKDQNSEEFKLAREILQTNPAVLARSDRALVIGDVIAGRAARLAREKQAAQAGNGKGSQSLVTSAATKVKPAPIPANGGAGSVRVDARGAAVGEAKKRFEESGRAKDLVKFLKANRG